MIFTSVLDSCRYIFLGSLSEPHENSLKAIIEEADATQQAENIQIGKVTISGAPIVPTGRIFELYWDTYVAYAIRNESFSSGKPDIEVFEGRLFRRYSKSLFLEFVQKSTFATADYPGPMMHFQLCCQNHIVDIVSVDAPVIADSRLDP